MTCLGVTQEFASVGFKFAKVESHVDLWVALGLGRQKRKKSIFPSLYTSTSDKSTVIMSGEAAITLALVRTLPRRQPKGR